MDGTKTMFMNPYHVILLPCHHEHQTEYYAFQEVNLWLRLFKLILHSQPPMSKLAIAPLEAHFTSKNPEY